MKMKIRAMINEQVEVPAWLKWRIQYPYQHLRKYGIDAKQFWMDFTAPEEDFDILVLPRIIASKADRHLIETWFKILHKSGIRIVFEADDDIWSESYIEHIAKVMIKRDSSIDDVSKILGELTSRSQEARWMMNQCDAVTVSTDEL